MKPESSAGRRTAFLFRAWFELTPRERLFVAALAAIALVGIVARYAHLRNQAPEPYAPQGVEKADRAAGTTNPGF